MYKCRVIKCISVLLSLLFLFSGAVIAFADDEPIVDPPVDEPIVEEEDPALARLYVCTHKNGFFETGHVFLYMENLSDETLMVGVYELPPNEGVSIGSFGFTRSDGFGVYFNVEAYCYNTYGHKDILCLSADLDQEAVERFSHRLLYSNTWDFFFFNCNAFAFMMWNTAASPFLMPLLFPVFGRLQIKTHGGETLQELFYPEKERVYKLRGTGSRCYLEPVREKSIDK